MLRQHSNNKREIIDPNDSRWRTMIPPMDLVHWTLLSILSKKWASLHVCFVKTYADLDDVVFLCEHILLSCFLFSLLSSVTQPLTRVLHPSLLLCSFAQRSCCPVSGGWWWTGCWFCPVGFLTFSQKSKCFSGGFWSSTSSRWWPSSLCGFHSKR